MRNGDDIVCVWLYDAVTMRRCSNKGFLEATNTRSQFKLVRHYWFFLFDNHAFTRVCDYNYMYYLS